jgi:hypothetical protein
MAGFQATDGLLIGYGYDRVMTNLSNYTSGSHELFLRFELFKRENKIVSPRFLKQQDENKIIILFYQV